MKPELIVVLSLILGLHGDADLSEDLLAVLEQLTLAALLKGEHATILSLMLFFIILSKLLKDERELELGCDALGLCLRHYLLKYLSWGIGQDWCTLHIGVVDISHHHGLHFLPRALPHGG